LTYIFAKNAHAFFCWLSNSKCCQQLMLPITNVTSNINELNSTCKLSDSDWHHLLPRFLCLFLLSRSLTHILSVLLGNFVARVGNFVTADCFFPLLSVCPYMCVCVWLCRCVAFAACVCGCEYFVRFSQLMCFARANEKVIQCPRPRALGG